MTTKAHVESKDIVHPGADDRQYADIDSMADMDQEVGLASITYIATGEGKSSKSPLNGEAASNCAMYDADGSPTTTIVLSNNRMVIGHHGFKTGNNAWSSTFIITVAVNILVLGVPDDRALTPLGVIPPATVPGTPLRSASTNIGTPPACICHAPFASIPYVAIASTAIVTIEVTNSTHTLAKDVMLDIITDGVAAMVPIGNLPSGATVVEQFLSPVAAGLIVVKCADELVDGEDFIMYGQQCSSYANNK